ncbi:MAG TPA: MBL fold metallo-hydrolase [Candidatus Thermoplasmatota archaeon]|nr:MBL fold metallo-hydrolase [Candidatus Thermoplasmatota archaeon]
MASSLAVQVGWDHGLVLRSLQGPLRLDCAKPGQGPSIVTHAHLDHLRGNAHMTEPTRDFLAARLGLVDARPLAVGAPTQLEGWEVLLHDAGHCLGAAMVEASGVLYTGDFNPVAALTAPGARPVACEVLVIESTYGDPRWRHPPRDLVLASLHAWLDRALPEGGVVLGCHQLGRAQELVAILNRRGVVPAVAPDIAVLCEIYVKHGVPLRFRAATPGELYGTLGPHQALVAPRTLLRKGEAFTRHLREAGGRAAYVSGWCAVYSYHDKYDIDAQFALTDHATFEQLLDFAAQCRPRRVFTVMGRTEPLARELARRLGVPAQPLG